MAASTVITGVADRLKTVIAALDVTPPVSAYRWTPQRLTGTGPFAVIELPRVERTSLNDPEEQLGSDDWIISYPVVLYVDLKDPDRDQNRLVDLLEAMTSAIDDNVVLADPNDPGDVNGDVQIMDVKVTAADPSVDQLPDARSLLAYECEVQVFKHVPTV
jgi:hypothetical protein